VPGSATRATFLDAGRQAEFERNGFVVTDLLDARALARLRDGYRALDHRHSRDSPFAEGFHTTLYDTRPSYRRAVADLFAEILDSALDQVLDRHRSFFANFAVKLPAGGAVPDHLDWSFVDETRFRSATVWCPLEPTDAENGALGVMVGSQHRVDFIRAVNDRDFEQYGELAASTGRRKVVPLAAGRAIVMDNRVVHFSPPNRLDSPRVVAACVVAPVEAALHHYWIDPDDQMLCFELDPAFYHSYVVGRPPADAEGVLGVHAMGPGGG